MIEKKYYKYLVYGLILFSAALFLLISKRLRAALFVTVFIVLNMILSSYKKFINAPIEIELLTAGIVFCTLTFGVKAGLVVAILGGILSFIVGFNVSPPGLMNELVTGLQFVDVFEDGAGRGNVLEGQKLIQGYQVQVQRKAGIGHDRLEFRTEDEPLFSDAEKQRFNPDAVPGEN